MDIPPLLPASICQLGGQGQCWHRLGRGAWQQLLLQDVHIARVGHAPQGPPCQPLLLLLPGKQQAPAVAAVAAAAIVTAAAAGTVAAVLGRYGLVHIGALNVAGVAVPAAWGEQHEAGRQEGMERGSTAGLYILLRGRRPIWLAVSARGQGSTHTVTPRKKFTLPVLGAARSSPAANPAASTRRSPHLQAVTGGTPARFAV